MRRAPVLSWMQSNDTEDLTNKGNFSLFVRGMSPPGRADYSFFPPSQLKCLLASEARSQDGPSGGRGLPYYCKTESSPFRGRLRLVVFSSCGVGGVLNTIQDSFPFCHDHVLPGTFMLSQIFSASSHEVAERARPFTAAAASRHVVFLKPFRRLRR